MAVTAGIPKWVTTRAQTISDLHWLAWRAGTDTGSLHAIGVENTLVWLTGGAPAPITGRPVGAVERSDAEREFRAAGAAADPVPALLALLSDELGVPDWTPPPHPRQWVNGVYETLRWLLGTDRPPPLELPIRTESGKAVSAEELFERAARSAPARYSEPEFRRELELETAREAARSQRLVELIEDTKRRETHPARG